MRKLGRQIRDICIAAIALLGIARLYRMTQKGPLVRVVVFHDVKDGEWFERMIEYLKKRYHVLSPEAFMAYDLDDTKINVLVTFDDGYASWVERCAPVLKRHRVQAVFFVNSGLIDAYGNTEAQETYVHTRLLLGPRDTLSWEGVRALQDAGHTIGGHTTTHARLSQVSEKVQREEVEGDQERISTCLGTPPVLFAYPFGRKGDYDDVSKHTVKEAGYIHAFTTEGRFVPIDGDPYAIPRLCLDDRLTERQLGRWIEGAYDVYAYLKSLCVR